MKDKRACAVLALAIGLLPAARAGVVYSETISGDLSNNGLAPTSVTVTAGSNQIFGMTGRGSAGVDRDYLSITVPSSYYLVALAVLPGTQSGGISFIGLQAGPQVTLPTNASDATGLLGWWHYSPADIGANILPEMAIPSEGSSGFTNLGAGTYSFWIQDFNAGVFNYGFDLSISAQPVPEPVTGSVVFLGLSLLCLLPPARPTTSRFN